MEHSFSLFFLAAIVLDLLLGDPRWYPHPVRLIGWLCSFLEENLRKKIPARVQLAGIFTSVLVLSCTAGVVYAALLVAHLLSPVAEVVLAVLLLYTAIAIRDLLAHSYRVYRQLKKGGLIKARQAVAMIVGRDTAALDRAGVIRAAVETVAENMADGIVAPLFWAMVAVVVDGLVPQFAAGGLAPISCAALGAFLYKACNTMDSMFGYKNERYIDFGCFAARLDDFVGYLPARITAYSLVIAAPFVGLSGRGALAIMLRDRANHASPNAGYPEAAMAGALGVQLGGAASYFGSVKEKPTIGDAQRNLESVDILRANRLVMAATVFFIFSALLLHKIFTVFCPVS